MSVRISKYRCAVTTILLALASGCVARQFDFTRVVVDENLGGRTAIGDIDGDGYNDIAVHTWSANRGVENDGKISGYEYPTWKRHSILEQGHIFGVGIVPADLDADGDNDVVTAKGNDGEAHVFWYANPGGAATAGWEERKVATVEPGSEGSLSFNLERLNEFQYHSRLESGYEQGFRTILATESDRPYISRWWPPGHIIGWEHTFIHEIADLMTAVATGKPVEPSFYDGLCNQQVLDAMQLAAAEKTWVDVPTA
ncbi:MAG: VCBS repeat-containing protein [Phycisphaerales bacterium]|nr:MAG: VCBS repeat-containing protein [Phycisphaerales bacterium]